MSADVKIESNKDLFLNASRKQIEKALESVGIQAEGYVKDIITEAGRRDTSAMINNATYAVEMKEQAVYLGSDVEYTVYHEVGTGIYAEGGGGRKTPWKYTDRKGEEHWTWGIKPLHMFKRAATEHDDEYRAIIEQALQEDEF